jgi:uncharacterized repeat protein (TIGR04076 family)
MEDTYKVKARIISCKGTCSAGHKVGEEFTINQKTPANMCSWAFYSVFPFVSVLQFNGSFPWEKDSNKAVVACPDADNQVVFELKRTNTAQ